MSEGSEQQFKVFVGGLDKQATDEHQLSTFFEEYGPVSLAEVMRDHQNASRGFGFVTFQTQEPFNAVMAAKEKGQTFNLDGKRLEVKKATPPVQNVKYKRIFVGGLQGNVVYRDLLDYFVQFGPVSDIDIRKFPDTGKPRGFAFVSFERESSADECIAKKEHRIDGAYCEVKRADLRGNMHGGQAQGQGHQNNYIGNSYNAKADIHSFVRSTASGSAGTIDIESCNKMVEEAYQMGVRDGMERAQAQYAGGNHQGGSGVIPGASPLVQRLMSQQGTRNNKGW